ncbi:MAG TPA: Hpt domain-containing protein [Candidatus Limnocylindrales bacterium]|jgi:HPt (histidine-containing phosphotransfer) domain-containing protein|nr:Hpt domain-containing protein [Candidatus Limnocylindrales bacterium]
MTLDPAALADMLDMVGDDPEFVGEVVDAYLADAPDQVTGMTEALAAGDVVTLGRHAHTLKGNSRNVGATTLAEIARSLEESARAGDTTDAADRIAAAADELGRVSAALAHARERGWRA